MLRSVFPVAATLAMISSAHAGGVPSTPPPPIVILAPVGQDWSGFYGGVQLEYGQGNIDYSANPGLGFPNSDVDGSMVGFFFGYRADYGSIVFGTEFDYVTGSLDANTPGITSIDTILRATLELGVDTGNAFIYGTAGVAGMFVTSPIGDSDWGGVYGIGIDYRVGERTTIGAELLQHEIGNFSGSGADVSVTTFGVNIGFQF